MGHLYKRVYRREFIWSAWRQIHDNGRSSKSSLTRKEVHEYGLGIERHVEGIVKALRTRQFEFAAQLGILQKRPGKSARPIVKSPIENRIVQRSILDVLQEEKVIRPFFQNPFSFGGIAGRSVRHAIELAYAEMTGGKPWFVRSDISEFFTKIPKAQVLGRIGSVIDDSEFLALLEGAVHTELSNMAELGREAEAFPIHEIGVAQGCCLSPFFANVLLSGFDKELNTAETTCIRFIDDFLILGTSKAAVAKAFRQAQGMLAKFSLRAYDPFKGEPKADLGRLEDGLDFLGCKIVRGQIRPNDKSARRMLNAIEEIFTSSEALFHDPGELVRKKKTYSETIVQAKHIALGWGNQYAFCNHPQFLARLDQQIAAREEQYTLRYTRRLASLDAQDRRRLLGLHQLVDSKWDPIIQPKEQKAGASHRPRLNDSGHVSRLPARATTSQQRGRAETPDVR